MKHRKNLVGVDHDPARPDRTCRRLAAMVLVGASVTIVGSSAVAGPALASGVSGPVAPSPTLSQYTLNPTCGPNAEGYLYCTETFTSSGWISGAALGTSSVDITAVGGHGGASSHGTPGGNGGQVTNQAGVSGKSLEIFVGGNGGNGSRGIGGSGGAYGGGNGGAGSVTGGSGGGGGGATIVETSTGSPTPVVGAAGSIAASVGATTSVVAPGGGGGADGANGGSAAASTGSVAAPGGGVSGGIGGVGVGVGIAVNDDAWDGQPATFSGWAGNGGSGDTNGSNGGFMQGGNGASPNTHCTGYACLVDNNVYWGAGGGGAGYYGGGGGATATPSQTASWDAGNWEYLFTGTNDYAGGNGGAGLGYNSTDGAVAPTPVTATSVTPSVTIGWYPGS